MENNIASILFARGIMPDDFISYSTYGAVAEIVKELKQLEAERSEVQQQVETLTKENEDLMHGQDKQAVDLVKLLDIIDEYEELLKMTLLRVRDSSLYKDIRASLRGVWNEDEPYKNGKYQVLVLMCDKPYEEKEDIDEYKDGYWLGYAQFVLGWKHLSRKQQREEALEAERSEVRNKVIEQAIDICKDYEVGWQVADIIEKLNSLKTK